MRLICITQAQRVVAKLANGRDHAFALGQWEAHTLILRKRRAESLAFRDIGPAFIK